MIVLAIGKQDAKSGAEEVLKLNRVSNPVTLISFAHPARVWLSREKGQFVARSNP